MGPTSASPPIQASLRPRLQLYLEVTKLAQRELSDVTGVPQAAISRFLAGARLRPDHASSIETALDHRTSSLGNADDPAVGPTEILWAVEHVRTMRDTDLLPRPPEYQVLESTSLPIVAALGAIDLRRHQPKVPRTFLVPKITGGFRTCHQLHPVDALQYAAAVHAVSDRIEKVRRPVDTVFSYRVSAQPKKSGLLWRTDVGWDQFITRGQELGMNHSHVLVADISDFYSQIALPMVVEALKDAGVSTARADGIDGLLVGFAGRRGRGIPIGPHPSALLAECVMGRVDGHLERQGRPFIRFVDDIRVYCNGEREAVHARHDLAAFLHERLGLGLNDSKTEVISTSEIDEQASPYADPMLDSPVDSEAGAVGTDGYSRAATRAYTQELTNALADRDPSMGLKRARWVLRMAPAGALDTTLNAEMLVRLVPIFREVCMHLLRGRPEPPAADLGRSLLYLAEKSKWADIPFVQLWVAEVLATRFASLGSAVDVFLSRHRRNIGLGAAATLAATRRDREWVRSYEREWRDLSSWDKRALLTAARVLTDSERARWADRAEEERGRDPLLLALAYEIREGDHG